MFERDTVCELYTLWQQRHISLIFLIKQLLVRQVALQGLAVNHTIPHQRFAITADQTRSQRFQIPPWDHLHHLQTTQVKLAVLKLEEILFDPASSHTIMYSNEPLWQQQRIS